MCPGFEDNQDPSGLHWDTRLRLDAAALLYSQSQLCKIIVGGDRIRQMEDSFANLMKKYLVQAHGVPAEDVITEEYTFDTASQFDWLLRHRRELPGKLVVLTDKWQALHVRALLRGFGLKDIPVLPINEVLEDYRHRQKYSRPEQLKWIVRELVLATFTRVLDPRGVRMQKITSSRKK